MKLITTLTVVLLMKISLGQVLFNNTFIKTNFDFADAVIERSDGKYLIAGSSRSHSVNDYDVNIMLVDSVGNLIWDRFIGQSPRMEFAYSLIETKDSNYLIVGNVNSNPYLLKFDSAGSLIWDKEYLSAYWTDGFSVGESYNGNYFFVRSDTSTTLFVTNNVGDTLWTKPYNFAVSKSVIQTSDTGFAFIGNADSTNLNQEIILIKTNSIGDTLWTKYFGGGGFDNANSVCQLPDNGYLIAGNFDTQILDYEWLTFIIRTNSFGDTLWTQKYSLGSAHYIAECRGNDGYILSTIKYVMGGIPSWDEYYLVITKLDTLGNIQWSRQFNGNTYSLGNNITQTSDGGYLLTGHIENLMSWADVVLIKLDSIGNYVLKVNDNLNLNLIHTSAFPNPTNNEISILLNSLNGRKIRQVKIFNSLGLELRNMQNINEYQIKTDVKDLATGLYFYELITCDNQIKTGKFIVKE